MTPKPEQFVGGTLLDTECIAGLSAAVGQNGPNEALFILLLAVTLQGLCAALSSVIFGARFR